MNTFNILRSCGVGFRAERGVGFVGDGPARRRSCVLSSKWPRAMAFFGSTFRSRTDFIDQPPRVGTGFVLGDHVFPASRRPTSRNSADVSSRPVHAGPPSPTFSLLERSVMGSGREKVDHPRGAHDDLANAAAGALVMAAQRGVAMPMRLMPSHAVGSYYSSLSTPEENRIAQLREEYAQGWGPLDIPEHDLPASHLPAFGEW